MRRVLHFVRLPLADYVAALQVALPRASAAPVAAIAIAAAATWWIYVPVHELAHAFGCMWTGGAVTRLDIDAIYGAALLQRYFPFVSVGSDYAGQLSGFDTHGNDLSYMATDLAPFLLTIFVGVPLLRAAPAQRTALRAALCLGVALPIAYAPFIALTGDYYEMGSIVISRLAAWVASVPLQRWRSDDALKLASQLFGAGGAGGWRDAVGMLAALLAGVVGSFVTYGLGVGWADVVLRHTVGGRRVIK